MPKQSNLPNTNLNSLSSYFYYVLLLAFLALPFFASYKLLNNPASEVFVVTPEADSMTVKFVPKDGNTMQPGGTKDVDIVVTSSASDDAEVDLFYFSTKIPSGLTVEDSTLPTNIVSLLPLLVLQTDPSNSSNYLTILVRQDGRAPFIVSPGDNVIATLTFKGDTEGSYDVSFDTAYGAVGVGPSGEGADARAGVNYLDQASLSNKATLTVSAGGTPTPTPTPVASTPTPTPIGGGSTPTPTPVAGTPTPTPVPGDLTDAQGLKFNIALQGRTTGQGAVRGYSHPVVFAGIWRQSTKQMIAYTFAELDSNGMSINKAGESPLATLFTNLSTELLETDELVIKPEFYLSKVYSLGDNAVSVQNGILTLNAPVAFKPGDSSIELGTFDIVNLRDLSFALTYYKEAASRNYDPYFLDVNGDKRLTAPDMAAYTNTELSGLPVKDTDINAFGKSGEANRADVSLVVEIERLMRNKVYQVITVN